MSGQAHYFKPIIGKRFPSPEFNAALNLLGDDFNAELLTALRPNECEKDSPLRALYNQEQILLIRNSKQEIVAIYRAEQPYESQQRTKPKSNLHYILPRYQLSKDYDKSLTAYLLYFLATNAHRYVEVIGSFYPSQAGGELHYDREDFLHYTQLSLATKLQIKDAFGKRKGDSEQVVQQKKLCKRNYNFLLKKLSKIILRRAEPFTAVTIDEVIDRVLQPRHGEIIARTAFSASIEGPNDEMELTTRQLILGLKLIMHDFNALSRGNYDKLQHQQDLNEFSALNEYLMAFSKFTPKKSDGLILEPSAQENRELTEVLKEIHGENGKIISILGQVPSAKKSYEVAMQKREDAGYTLLSNRIEKISRCAYYIDKEVDELLAKLPKRPNSAEIKAAAEDFRDLAKLKVFTAASSEAYFACCQDFLSAAAKLANITHAPQTLYTHANERDVLQTISNISAMTETKRRKESSKLKPKGYRF